MARELRKKSPKKTEAAAASTDVAPTSKSPVPPPSEDVQPHEHPLTRMTEGMNPRSLLTGLYGPRGERIRHVVRNGALSMPREALSIMAAWETQIGEVNPDDDVAGDDNDAASLNKKGSKGGKQADNNKGKNKRPKYDLPGLDSVVRPTKDAKLATITVTDVYSKLVVSVVGPDQTPQPPRLRTFAVNRTLDQSRFGPSTSTTAVGAEAERIRGGGEDDDTNTSSPPPPVSTLPMATPNPLAALGANISAVTVPPVAVPTPVLASTPNPLAQLQAATTSTTPVASPPVAALPVAAPPLAPPPAVVAAPAVAPPTQMEAPVVTAPIQAVAIPTMPAEPTSTASTLTAAAPANPLGTTTATTATALPVAAVLSSGHVVPVPAAPVAAPPSATAPNRPPPAAPAATVVATTVKMESQTATGPTPVAQAAPVTAPVPTQTGLSASAPSPAPVLPPVAMATDQVQQVVQAAASTVVPLTEKPPPQWEQQVPAANDENLTDPQGKAPKPDWYSPDNVSDFERAVLPEWFNQSAKHRTEETYKVARETIIKISDKLGNRFVTCSMIRRSIPGDIGSLHRLQNFLTSYFFINEDAMNDSAPTPAALQEGGTPLWTEKRRADLMNAVVEESEKHSATSKFVPIDWEAIATKVGGYATKEECEREFLIMPLDEDAEGGVGHGTVERSITPDTMTSEHKDASKVDAKGVGVSFSKEAFMRELLQGSSPQVVSAVTEAALQATDNDLAAAQKAAILGLVVSQATVTARHHEDALSRLLGEVVDQRMQRLENRMALMDDLEGVLEAERVALELERRDLYTTRCRDWFGGN